MAVSAHDVVRELRLRLPRAGRLSVHKMLYYCQGWYLAWTGEPMFREQIEGWANGPVVADVWHDEDKGRGAPPPSDLEPAALEVLDYVVARYGRLSGPELVQLTHSERPWAEASQSDVYNPPLTTDVLRMYFSESDGMAEEARQAAALLEQVDLYSVNPRDLSDARRAVIQGASAPGTSASGPRGG